MAQKKGLQGLGLVNVGERAGGMGGGGILKLRIDQQVTQYAFEPYTFITSLLGS